MAARKTILGIRKGFLPNIRQIHSHKSYSSRVSNTLLFGASCGCFLALQAWKRYQDKKTLPNGRLIKTSTEETQQTASDETPNESIAQKEREQMRERLASHRAEKFKQFASVKYEGQLYMTPQDFLDSINEDKPRVNPNQDDQPARIGVKELNPVKVKAWLAKTPPKKKGSKKLFRTLQNQGLISYTEYLFLLCILTKPPRGFKIAFNMFDTDGNQIVDKKEFLVLEEVFSNQRVLQPKTPEDSKSGQDKLSIFGDKKFPISVEPIQDTSLLIHFFGKKGTDVLKYQDFHTFMINLQTEVMEVEFLAYSDGMDTISDEDFANILLRYTMLTKAQKKACINRVRTKMSEEKGILFDDFYKFFQFMNSLEDFSIAMNLYTYAGQAISPEEFQRAVYICTGSKMSDHIVKTLFLMFDTDGDGHLSYKEFISIMKDRKYRGMRSSQQPWPLTPSGFRKCIMREFKAMS